MAHCHGSIDELAFLPSVSGLRIELSCFSFGELNGDDRALARVMPCQIDPVQRYVPHPATSFILSFLFFFFNYENGLTRPRILFKFLLNLNWISS